MSALRAEEARALEIRGAAGGERRSADHRQRVAEHSTASQQAVEALVARARDGDHSAFEQLVRLTSPTCYSLAFRLVGNEHDARDVVQEAYLRAYRSLRRFRGDAAFSTWLHRVTVNCAADLLEGRRKSVHDALDDVLGSAPLVEQRAERNPEIVASAADDRERLVQALRELPHELRLVVVLRDVYDLPHREIARELGISQGAAKVRLHRARLRLRERLFPPPLLSAGPAVPPELRAHEPARPADAPAPLADAPAPAPRPAGGSAP